MKFTLLILCKNEIECLKAVLPQINKDWVEEALLVDGGSTDGSIEFAEQLGFNVYRQKEKGIIAGYREAMAVAKGDAVIIFTPDGNMIPEKIPELTAKMRQGYDAVIVSRYKDGAKSYDDTLVSGFGNWMFTKMVNVLFKADYTDVLGGYKAYRKDIFERLGIEIKDRPVETRVCIRMAKKGFKFAEIPGDEPKRVAGSSYRSIVRNGLNELSIIIEEFFNIRIPLVDRFLKF